MKQPGFRLRLYLLTCIFLFGFGVLLTRLHEFQIERRNEFLSLVPGNRSVTVREPGIRGEITDRKGVTLAKNHRKYEISFNLEEVRQAYSDTLKDETSASFEKDQEDEEKKDIVAIMKDGEDSIIERLKKLGLARNFNAKALRLHYLTHKDLIPFSYTTDLTYEEFARFAEHSHKLPGVYLTMRPERDYPYGTLASHVLGHLKQWEKGDIPEAEAHKFKHYIGDETGIAGIEASMNDFLLGPAGTKTMVKNEKGQTIRMTDHTPPDTGAKVVLTLDARKQFLVENVIRRIGRGAGVVMDVNTGEVLAMASVPDYDPNAFIPSIDPEQWKRYNENVRLSPFTNRAISSFTPGSTMKVPTAIAGALKGMATRSFSCNGYVAYGNHKVGCWLWNKNGGRHGGLTLSKALQQSCNPYFNTLANTIGWKAMVEGCEKVGFGGKTGIELPQEDPGTLPGNRAWRSANPDAFMTPVLTAFLSIGQGDTLATPLQLCAMTACVANGGKYFKPRIVKRVVSSEGKVLLADKPDLKVDLIKEGIEPEHFERIREGMRMAVNVPGGTANRVKMPNILIAAKTGTAQTSDAGKKSNNSWVISFAPYENPRYAVCVLAQNAGSGGAVCGPLVHLIYRGLFAEDEGLRLPLKPQTEFGGNTDRYEEIALPTDVIAAIEASGETGEEAGDLTTSNTIKQQTHLITPTLSADADAEGTIVPRARQVEPN